MAHHTDLYVIPANWPESRREHWMALLRARAIENQAYVIGCNRVGDGGGLHYVGDSMMVDPLGVVLEQGNDSEMILMSEISATKVAETRTRFPFLQDRR
jgi:predicted amidohydrolase